MSSFSCGDILEPTNRSPGAGEHYIIYFQLKDDYSFIGCMLTSSSKYGNIPMADNHFEIYKPDKTKYKISYKHSCLVSAKLIKPEAWSPFYPVGRLSKDGINFLKEKIDPLTEITWDEYISKK